MFFFLLLSHFFPFALLYWVLFRSSSSRNGFLVAKNEVVVEAWRWGKGMNG